MYNICLTCLKHYVLSFSEKVDKQLNMEEIGIDMKEETTPVAATKESVSVKAEQQSAFDELDNDDLYVKFKRLQEQLEFLEVQEEYIKERVLFNLKKKLEYMNAGKTLLPVMFI